jgi:hypothetical protein
MIGNAIAGFLGAGVAASTTAYESIATFTVGAGGSSPITFSSIPSTYTHLQLRILARGSSTAAGGRMIFNADTATNYSLHYLEGDGSTASAGASSSAANLNMINATLSTDTANIFAVNIVDILDYTNTNKYKTVKSMAGNDKNGAGVIDLFSGNWRSTSAISTITITIASGVYAQNSQFALYGIKG